MFIRITVSLLLILAACSTSINAVALKPSCECTTVYIQAPPPVCGDGIEYMDDCRAKCAGAKTITAGPCPTKASAADCVCTMNFEPVCGSDGRTYPNACTAGCASVSVVSRGPCHCDRCPKVNKPVCGSDGETYSHECRARCAGVDIAKNGQCGCICPFIYEPVCANGMTYGNICEAQCANVRVKDTVAGECKK